MIENAKGFIHSNLKGFKRVSTSEELEMKSEEESVNLEEEVGELSDLNGAGSESKVNTTDYVSNVEESYEDIDKDNVITSSAATGEELECEEKVVVVKNESKME